MKNKKNGKYEKDDGIYWYVNGKLHREDGPAIEWKDGSQGWFVEGKCHCETGPAIQNADGKNQWFIHNISISEEDYQVWCKNQAKNNMSDNNKVEISNAQIENPRSSGRSNVKNKKR